MRNFALFICLSSLLIIGCRKEEEEIYTQSAKDATFAAHLSFDVLREVQRICPEFIVNQSYSSNSIIVTSTPDISNSDYPKTISINYGTETEGIFGEKRSGIIMVTINSGNILSDSLHISFDDYNVGGTQINGEIEFNFTNNIYQISFGENGLSLVNANGTMLFNGSGTLSLSSNNNTVSILDDIYEASFDNVTGVDYNQRSFTYASSNQIVDFNCSHLITDGTAIVTPNQKNKQTISYGSNSCDNLGSVTNSSSTQANFNF